MNRTEILDAISSMSVLELSELIKDMEEKFGVSAAAPMMAAAPAAAESGEGGAGEEKTQFDLVLTEVGSNKVSVIKAVRQITSLGLKEAKDLVESAPAPIKEGVAKADAEESASVLREAGATCEVK